MDRSHQGKVETDVLISDSQEIWTARADDRDSGAGRAKFLQGWRKGVAAGAAMAALTLLVNVIASIVFVKQYGHDDGFATLFQGSCRTASRVNFGIHLIINTLSTLLLASSNYCMQVLSAPVRQEVDRAHARGKWLDIGLSSARNLLRISRWRLAVWCLLVVSTLPLHLVYNSVVFSTIHAYQYTAVVATPGFVTGPTYNGTFDTDTTNQVIGNAATLADIQTVQAGASQYERLDNAQCIDPYKKALVTDRSDVILVTMLHNATDDESQVYMAYRDGDFYLSFSGVAAWLGDSLDDAQTEIYLQTGIHVLEPSNWILERHKIDHCLSRQEAEQCTVRASIYLTAVVIVCNVFKLLGLLSTLFKYKEQPLVTIGDAIESFMGKPDELTMNACLLSRADVKSGKFARETAHVKSFKRKRVFRFHAVSGMRWWLSLLACIAGINVIAVFLDLSIIGVNQSGTLPGDQKMVNIKQLWTMGFGLGDGTSFWSNAPNSLYGNIVLANLPQLIFSMLYFVYNGLYTVMSLAAEWAAFSVTRKALRVSRPRGAQRSTYYLQLPLVYAVPLIIASTAMHWLISQSFYVLAVDFSGSSPDMDISYSTCGYSPIAIIFSLALASVMVAVIFLNGFRRVTFGMPVVGGCSLAIGAACHAPASGAEPTVPLQWGVTGRGEDGIGHCAFSAEEVVRPIVGERYA